ncbi:hypothetical protein OK016_24285 [Vibrio chagasii]|nr:hypothetical protein [Vibrio chagasii]
MEVPLLGMESLLRHKEANKATNLNPEQGVHCVIDGSDSDETYLQKLVDQGLCKLRSTISAETESFPKQCAN